MRTCYHPLCGGRRHTLIAAALVAFAGYPAVKSQTVLVSPNPEQFGHFGRVVAGAGDVTGDGVPDLIVGAGERPSGRVYLFDGATSALVRTLVPPQGGGFGQAVVNAGDVTGDGVPDQLIGDPGTNTVGRAYLFDGATGGFLHALDSANPRPGGYFGISVANAGDVTGDGIPDQLVGAEEERVSGTPRAGRAYLFDGATGALVRGFVSSAPQAGGFFGGSVAGVGDVSGDGIPDQLVGAAGEEFAGLTYVGKAHLFDGATGGRIRTLVMPNPELFARFGSAVASAGDVTGDAIPDLLVGAEGADRAYLFDGATSAPIRALTDLDPEAPDVNFGGSVANAGDVTGDGIPDQLVGAIFEEVSGVQAAGRAYLFDGATGAFLRTLESANPEYFGQFGGSVASVGDVTGDGFPDQIVGAEEESVPGFQQAGRAYVFSGASSPGVTLSASGSPTTIPPGGTVTVTVAVTNMTSQPVSLDLWIVATQDGGPELTRLVGSGTLLAGATFSRSFNLRAPGNTPPGLYTVHVNVGVFPNPIFASDAFDLTVTGERLAGTSPGEPFIVAPVPGDVFAPVAPSVSAAPAGASVAASPNPFASQTVLQYALPEAAEVRLVVYDVLGREVARLAEGEVEAGNHAAVFDASALPGGVYVVRLVVDARVLTCRVTHVR